MLVIESVNNDAGTQKQQGFEERMGYEVKHGRLPCAHTKRQEHVANLTDGRVGKDALDVMLDKRAEAREEQCARADNCHRQLSRWRQREKNVRPRDEINARGHHGRGVK